MQSLGLVPALDLETLDDLKRVVDATCDIDEVVEYKLGMHAVLHIGLFNALKPFESSPKSPSSMIIRKPEQTCPTAPADLFESANRPGSAG